MPDAHYDEMSEQDLRNVMAYVFATLSSALREGEEEALVEVLQEWYDEVFEALAEVSERFRENVRNGSVFPPGGPRVREKYLEIIKRASES